MKQIKIVIIFLLMGIFLVACGGKYKSLIEKGDVADDAGEYQTALGYYEQALALAVKNKSKENEALAIYSIGRSYSHQGLDDLALENLQEALSKWTELGDTEGEGDSLGSIALVYQGQEKYAAALDAISQALVKYENLGDKEKQGRTLSLMGNIYMEQGQYDLSLSTFQEALEISQEINNRELEAGILGGIALIHIEQNSYEQGIEYFNQSLGLFNDLDDIEMQATALLGLGTAYNALNQYDQAVDVLKQAQSLLQENDDVSLEAEIDFKLGVAYYYLGEYPKSLEQLEQSIQLFQKETGVEALENLSNAWKNIAIVQQEISDYEATLHSYQELLSVYELLGDTELAQMVKDKIATLPKFEFNVNLIQNPGNEEPLVNGEILYWEEVEGRNWSQGAEVPVYEGNSYFDAGEAGSYAELRQVIDVSGFATHIDKGQQEFSIEAYMRSYPLQVFVPVDAAQLGITFFSEDGEPLEQIVSQTYFITDHWAKFSDVLLAPEGTRLINVRLGSLKYGGYDSDGYFDNLSLIALPSE